MTDGETAPHPPSSAVEEEFGQLSRRPGDSTVSRADLQRDETVRRWGLVTPSATRIGRADSPDGDLSENVRRLHEECHPAMEGYSERAHRLKNSASLMRCAAISD